MRNSSSKHVLSTLVVVVLAVLTLMTAYAAFSVAAEIRQFIIASTAQSTSAIIAEEIPGWCIISRDMISALLIITSIVLYTLFCSDILQRHIVFDKKQCRRLFSIGMLLLIDSAVSFLIDCTTTFSTSTIPAGTALGVLPFSPWILITSLLSLSLSFIFERARLLQEDVDDIL